MDLYGGTILPGFIDAHAHPVFAGDQLRRCDLEGAGTAPGYAALVAAYARDVAVNRSLPATAGGQGGDSFLPEQALGLASILAAYTSGSARVNGLDALTGSIQEGFDADFAIVNADLAYLPAREICQAMVTQTWIRGQVVYQQH